jgi:chemotaxis protein CheZ
MTSSPLALEDMCAELDSVVQATLNATTRILEAAEEIEITLSSNKTGDNDRLLKAITSIYEASTFQDLTGQRINKVLKNLKQLQLKGMELAATTEHLRIDANNPNTLLNGPALEGTAPSQDDIDKLFDNL